MACEPKTMVRARLALSHPPQRSRGPDIAAGFAAGSAGAAGAAGVAGSAGAGQMSARDDRCTHPNKGREDKATQSY